MVSGDTFPKDDGFKIPLSIKLKAWWEGYDIRDVEAYLRARQAGKKAAAPKPDKPRAPEPLLKPGLPVKPWDNKRIEISQFIWGEGYCGPGGPDHVIALSKLLALSPEMSALVVGAGLGGPARVLAQEFGVWITGVEEIRELAEAGMELSTRAGMARKAEIKHFDPKNPDFPRKFDRAFAKEAFYTVQDKFELLQAVHDHLKGDGLFLLTDYFLASEGVSMNADYTSWRADEAPKPHPITMREMEDMLRKVGFNIRVNEDMTQSYVTMIAQAWANADDVISKLLTQGEEGRALVDVLMREAEHWSRRSRLLKDNQLQVHRLLLSKKSPHTLSDW